MIETIFFNPWIWIVGVIILIAIISMIFIGIMVLDGGVFNFMIGGTTLILAAFYFGAILPPYDTDFYKTYRITGEITTLESAFSGDEGTMSQVFVAEVDGVDKYIKSDDQRFRTLSVGDDVNLVCVLQFAYFQDPWYDCSFGGR